MVLYLIGVGLNDEKDLTLRGLEVLRKADFVYLENYTSLLNSFSKPRLEELIGKEVIIASRNFVELKDELITKAKDKTVVLLVIGDPFGATTHLDIILRAWKSNVKVKILHNASVMNAIGATGLQLYKFGKAATVPYPERNFNPVSYYDALVMNKISGLHTLFLLDIKEEEGLFMSVNEAINFLLKLEQEKKRKVFFEDTLCVGCARLGGDNQVIVAGPASLLKDFDFGKSPHSLIVPGELHFAEKEALEFFKI